MDSVIARLRDVWQSMIKGSGGHCPVCDKWGKVSAITMTGTCVRSLIWLRNEHIKTGQGWIHVPSTAPRYVMRSYSISSLKHWGLVQQRAEVPEPKEKGKPKTKYSGYWRITPVGQDFLDGLCQMPKKVFIYNDARWGASDDMTHARNCLDEQFDYDAMMRDTLAGSK